MKTGIVAIDRSHHAHPKTNDCSEDNRRNKDAFSSPGGWSLRASVRHLEYDGLLIFAERHLERVHHFAKRHILARRANENRHQIRVPESRSANLFDRLLHIRVRTIRLDLRKLLALCDFHLW